METKDIRKDIIYFMNQPQTTVTLYDELKSCLIIDDEYTEPDNIDLWFKGIIDSLFYNPNPHIISFIGYQAIGKTEFFRRLLPQKEWFSDSRVPYGLHPDIHKHLIIDMTDYDIKLMKKVASSDGFITNILGDTNKRLASICHTSNLFHSEMLGRKRTIIVALKDIDRMRLNEIDKTKLWIEIFHKFKK